MKRTFVHLTGMRGDGFGPALVGLALLSSCSGASLDTGNERAGSVGAASAEGGRLQPGVLVLGPADVAELSLQPDRLRFERLPAVLGNAKEGDVIASGVEGKSFLRRISRVVKEQAVEVFTTDARVFDLTSELRTRKKIELPPVRVDASGRILVGTAEKGVTCTKCIVQFNPVINVGVNVNDSKLESFAVEFDGLMTANLEVSAVSPENAKVDTEAKLFEQSFHFLQNVGPVPIWEDVTVTVLARAQGQTDGKTAIRIGLGEEKRIRGLLAFEGASWDAFQEGPAKFVQENPTLSVERQGLAKLTLVPRVDVKLYGISGAAIEVGAAVQLDARACNKPPLWKTTSGLNVAVSGDLRAFQAEGRFEKELFREEKDLAAGDLPAGTTCPP